MTIPPPIFDRKAISLHRSRYSTDKLGIYTHIAGSMVERINDFNHSFPRALAIGSPLSFLASSIIANSCSKVSRWDFIEESSARLKAMPSEFSAYSSIADNLLSLDFADSSFDLIVSFWQAHLLDDLPSLLLEFRRLLRPEGVFLACFPGGETLLILRHILFTAEDKLYGGASQRVAPMLSLHDSASLLQKLGFALPVADRELLNYNFSSLLDLCIAVRTMGESNAMLSRRQFFTARDLFREAEGIYPKNSDASLSALLELIWLHGRKSNS